MLTLQEIRDYKDQAYKTVPLVKSYYMDEMTAITALKKLKKAYERVFMLESAVSNTKTGRYSFLGGNPQLEISALNGKVRVKDQGQEVDVGSKSPEEVVRQLLEERRSPYIEDYPPFTGGLVGYFAYEFYQYQEPAIDFSKGNVENLPDMDLMLFNELVCYDHYKHQILIISHMTLEGQIETHYQEALEKIDLLYRVLMQGSSDVESKGRMTSGLRRQFGKEDFMAMVDQAKDRIKAGDISQVVLSNALKADFKGSLLDSYRVLRSLNPSPYMIYFSSPDLEIAGASPETLGTLEGKTVKTYPLAGTRPRGASRAEDQALEEELLEDQKEISEHDMLVEIGKIDLAKVCSPETVEVESYMDIHKYSHVMHIGSCVAGQLQEGRDAMDIIKTLLPAGTLSGYPKLTACQLIQELEGDRRDIYGGAIGYIGLNGNMDACIAIRLIFKREDEITVRSGAGIVAQSNPEKEFQECVNKAQATVDALEEQKKIT